MLKLILDYSFVPHPARLLSVMVSAVKSGIHFVTNVPALRRFDQRHRAAAKTSSSHPATELTAGDTGFSGKFRPALFLLKLDSPFARCA